MTVLVGIDTGKAAWCLGVLKPKVTCLYRFLLNKILYLLCSFENLKPALFLKNLSIEFISAMVTSDTSLEDVVTTALKALVCMAFQFSYVGYEVCV